MATPKPFTSPFKGAGHSIHVLTGHVESQANHDATKLAVSRLNWLETTMNASSEHSLSDSSEISVSLPAIISTENGDSLSQLTTNKMAYSSSDVRPSTAPRSKRENLVSSQTLPLSHYNAAEWEMRECLLQKDQQLLRMNSEISRMAFYEAECKKKDELIGALKEELALYQKNLREKDYKYVELEEMLSLKEKEILEKTHRLEELSAQIKSIESSVKISSVHGNFLHKELTQKDSIISSLQSEIRAIRQNNKATIDQLTTENSEKLNTITSLQDRLKNLRNAHQSLQKRHENLQHQKKECATSEQELRAQLTKLKSHQYSTKELKDQLQVIQKQHLTAQERESKLQNELRNSQKQWLDLCIQVTNITSKWYPRGKDSTIPNGSDALLGVTQLVATYDKVTGQLEEIKSELHEHQVMVDGFQNFVDSLHSAIPKEINQVDFRDSLDSTLQQLHQLTVHDGVSELKVHLCTYLQAIKIYSTALWTELTELKDAIKQACQQTGIDSNGSQYRHQIIALLDKCKSYQVELEESQKKVSSLEAEHSTAMSSIVTSMKLENEQNLTATVEAIKEDEKNRFSKEMEEMRQHLEEDKAQTISEAVTGIQEQLKLLKDQYNSKELELQCQLEASTQMKEKIAYLESEVSSLMNDLIEKTENEKALLAAAKEENEKLKVVLQSEINEYKEQSRQHAITIVALEQKVLNLVANNGKLYSSNDTTHRGHTTQASQTDFVHSEEHSKQKELLAVLRRQLDFCQQEITTLNNSNGDLEKQLKASFNQTEIIKDQLESENRQQVSDLHVKLGDQENILSAQKNEIKQLVEKLDEKEVHIKELVSTIEAKDKLLSETMQSMMTQQQENNDIQVMHSHDGTESSIEVDTRANTKMDTKASVDFSRIGTQCLGEEHQRVITQQKEVLAQLRAKLKQLEEVKPPVPQHEAALREIVELRRRLNEFQANALTQNHLHSVSALEMKTKVEKAKQKTAVTMAQVSAQQTAQKDSTLTLEMSEKSYFNLLSLTCKSLSMDIAKDGLSLVQVPQNLRQKVLAERRKIAEVIGRQIKELTQHINEKDHLLSSYQYDLQTIKKTSEDTNAKLVALESLMSDAHGHIEQNTVLRNDLLMLQEELDQQQRLIQALLRRKNAKR